MKVMIYAIFGIVLLGAFSNVEAKDIRPECTNVKEHVKCVVQLPDSISMQDNYGPLINTLNGAKKGDKVYIKLSGFGGNAYTMMKLGSAMKSSEATVTTEIVGPVYSAHAFLSLAGDEMIIRDYAFFMFHRLRSFDRNGNVNITPAEICRGRTQIDKCIANSTASLKATHDTLLRYGLSKLLTKKELKRFMDGYDVYILGPDMARRLDR